jgi:hypothetical protein
MSRDVDPADEKGFAQEASCMKSAADDADTRVQSLQSVSSAALFQSALHKKCWAVIDRPLQVALRNCRGAL